MATRGADLQAPRKILPAPDINKASSSQADTARTAPQMTEQSAQDTESSGVSSTISENLASSYVGQQTPSFRRENVQQSSGQSITMSTPDASRAVSLAFLMSLNLNFTPEQLRLLKAHTQPHPALDTTPATPTLHKVPGPTSVDHPVDHAMAVSSSSSKAASVSAMTSSTLPKVTSAALESQVSPVASALSASLKSVLRPDETGSGLQAAATNQATKSAAVKSGTITNCTKPQLFSSTPAPRATYPSVPNRVSATAISRSEMLREHREMIIGSQVYRNRYSHVAGSLVDKFGALSLADPAPTPIQTPQPKPATASAVQAAPATATAPATRSVAPLLRPRFIPDEPVSYATVPAILIPTAVNPPTDGQKFIGPGKKGQTARTTHSGRVLLPPHLVGKVANPDPGAAARAQYSS